MTITPGMKLGGGAFEVLSLDPSGKRCVVGCACGGTRVFSTEALVNGTATCGAIPPTVEAVRKARIEAKQQQRARDLKNWRPGSAS